MPEGLGSLVTGLRAGEDLKPVAKLKVTRTVHRLVTEEGALMAEVADDLVDAATLGDASGLSAWREIEVELKPAGSERVLRLIGKRLRAAGAERSTSRSKLRRALGTEGGPPPTEAGTVGALVTDYLLAQGREFVRCDLAVRMAESEVHKFRVAIRRMRSTLRVFGAQVAELPAELVLGPVAAQIEETLLLERADHLSRLTAAMDGERYASLVRQIMQWQAAPPLAEPAHKPAAATARYVKRAERKVRKRLDQADGEVEALHRARKAAKRYRYAAELSAPALGGSAARTVKSTKKLQTQLGEHQDSVVSAAFLRRMGAEDGAGEGQNGFTYGLLLAREWHRAEQVSRDAGRRWGKKH